MKRIVMFLLLIAACTAGPNAAFSQTTNPPPSADSLRTVTLKVKGITCATDLKMISASVEKLKGVSSCKSGRQGPSTSFDIKYHPALVTEKEILAAIEGTGSCENPDERPYKVKQ